MNTFGVPLSDLCPDSQSLPTLLTKCVQEIHRRGLTIKGLYRVSGVKSRVEKMCQAFETGGELVELRDVHPNVLAGVLKMFLRQLPEPLLTFRLYAEFIAIAKQWPAIRVDHPLATVSATGGASIPSASNASATFDSVMASSGRSQRQLIKQLKQAVTKLPEVHLNTLAYLIKHLRRVADQQEENHMPASNLGIVFGPTLLRGSEGQASLSSLVDTVHQTRLVELLIMYCYELFGGNLMEDADLFDSFDPLDSRPRSSTGLEKSATVPEVRSSVGGPDSISSALFGSKPATSNASISSAISSVSTSGSIVGDMITATPYNAQVAGDLQQMLSQLNCEDPLIEGPIATHLFNLESEPSIDRNNNHSNNIQSSNSDGSSLLGNTATTTTFSIRSVIPPPAPSSFSSASTSVGRPNVHELRRQFFTQEPIASKMKVHLASEESFDDSIDTVDSNRDMDSTPASTDASKHGSLSRSSQYLDSNKPTAAQNHDARSTDAINKVTGACAITSIAINTGSALSSSTAAAATTSPSAATSSNTTTSLRSTLRPANLTRSGNSINLLHAKEDNREPKFV